MERPSARPPCGRAERLIAGRGLAVAAFSGPVLRPVRRRLDEEPNPAVAPPIETEVTVWSQNATTTSSSTAPSNAAASYPLAPPVAIQESLEHRGMSVR